VRSTLSALFLVPTLLASLGLSQVVPVQANIDAQAQRRMQEQTEVARRQRRIEDHLQRIVPALDPQNLTGPKATQTTSQALAALFSLQVEGVSPREALRRAVDCSDLTAQITRAPMNYLFLCWETNAKKITSPIAQSMRSGSPAPFPIAPFAP
jgi:hypothetical protein